MPFEIHSTTRRGFLARSATAGVIDFATTMPAGMPGLSAVQSVGGSPVHKSRVRPFRMNFLETALHGLRHRILAIRWPDWETVADALKVVIPSLPGYGFSANAIGRRCGRRRGGLRVFRQVRAQ
jgi:hypothetical protein